MVSKLPHSHLMSYKIGRGEQGVFFYEPWKSDLLPLWRFRTVPIARESSEKLYAKFLEYHEIGDFPGMDMARKFIQMGMTRAKRYANYKGGKKYAHGKGNASSTGGRIEKSNGHEGKEEKERASLVFREVWQRCKEFDGYIQLQEDFKRKQKAWEALPEKERAFIQDEESGDGIKEEDVEETTDTKGKSEKAEIKIKAEQD